MRPATPWPRQYRDAVVLVTGASSGIGYVTAREFAKRGSTVVGVARREDRLRQLMDECQPYAPSSTYLVGDLGDRTTAECVVDETVSRYEHLDVLINNAGVSKHKQLYHMSADEAETVIRVNFLSCVWTSFAAIPHMLRQGGGTIVNISSFAAKVAPPRETIYAASKAAMNAFTEGLWHDLAGSNIHAAIINPGPIDTEIWLKEDEPVAYVGRKYPAELVSTAIFEAIEKRQHEITVPKRSLPLVLARFMRLIFPGALRTAMARWDPVPPVVIERARQRAIRGNRLGDLGKDGVENVAEPGESP